LRSPDPEATAVWLQDILGGVIIRGPNRIDVKLGGANVFIAPVTAGDGVNSPPLTPYQGLDHFGLTVKDIDAVAAEIKGKGVEFTKEPTTIRPGVRICFIRGPQGISIELLERDKNMCDPAVLTLRAALWHKKMRVTAAANWPQHEKWTVFDPCQPAGRPNRQG